MKAFAQHLSIFLLYAVAPLSAQTTLYYEAFDNGVLTFDLNTTDVSSAGAGGYNKFVINDNYIGGSGSTTCLGFPFTFNVPSTASQPAGISGSPNSKYLHTISNVAENSGIYSCCFLAADGVCSNGQNYFSEMNIDVSTMGFTGVTFSFWWLCQGGSNNYGEVYYSIDGGSNWNLISSPIAQYRNQSNWSQVTITNALFDNQATLRFGFRFVNQQTISAADPGFGVDDLLLTGNTASQPDLAVDSVSGNPFCLGENITIEYTAGGAFSTGNVFTVELSDSTGSFANPDTIGSVVSATSGGISAIIPIAALNGSGYRIRVVSSNPVIVSNDNGYDLTVGTIPAVSLGTLADVCEKDVPFPMYGGSPPGGDYIGTGVSNNIFSPQASGIGTFNIIYTFLDFNGCSDTSTNKITVNPSPDAASSGLENEYCTHSSAVNLVGSPSGGTFLGNGISGNVFTPAEAGEGESEIQYIFINQQNCADTAVQVVMVSLCDGISDESIANFSISFIPATNELKVKFYSFKNEVISLKGLNVMGQELWHKRIHSDVGDKEVYISLDYKFHPGIYFLIVKGAQTDFFEKFAVSY